MERAKCQIVTSAMQKTNQGVWGVDESDWWLLYLGVQEGFPEKITLMLDLNDRERQPRVGLGVSVPGTGQSWPKDSKAALQQPVRV